MLWLVHAPLTLPFQVSPWPWCFNLLTVTDDRFLPSSWDWSVQQDRFLGKSISRFDLTTHFPLRRYSLPRRHSPRSFQHRRHFKRKVVLLTHRKCVVKDLTALGFPVRRERHLYTWTALHLPTCQDLHVGIAFVGGMACITLAAEGEFLVRLIPTNYQGLLTAQLCIVSDGSSMA